MNAQDDTGPRIYSRTLNAREIDAHGVTRLLDRVKFGDQNFWFLGTGTLPEVVAMQPAPGSGLLEDIRAVSGGTLVVTRDGDGLAMRDGSVLSAEPSVAEPEIFAGKNVLFGIRAEETPAQIADWIDYHVTHHGASAALIVLRGPEKQLGKRLQTALRKTKPIDLVLLSSPIALGKPDMGTEAHPYYAPDAPGKDRMIKPAIDPWRSELGEHLIYELCKWRFLSKARSVARLDPCDFLVPNSRNLFDLCQDARDGVVTIRARLIYPWRVRTGRKAKLGDHICLRLDKQRMITRWVAAPQLTGLEKTWRATRIAYTNPDAVDGANALRAMAIRVPDRATGELVPKTSLIEDDELLHLSTEVLGHQPVRAPVIEVASSPAPSPDNAKTAIVTTMKNEGPFILEWLAYHRAIGVTDFLIYTNDCTDGTDTMLDLLQSKGLVQHRANPWRPGDELRPQHTALRCAEDEPIVQNADWRICMDVDEFINIKIGDGTLKALYRAMGDANMISLTWRLFGDSDVVDYQDRFVTEQFSRCAPEIIRKPHQAWGFKTLYRDLGAYKRLGVHRPKGLKTEFWDQLKWLNGSGQEMPKEMLRTGWRSSLSTYGYDWVQLNHYAVRSVDSFLVKRDRGRVNHVDRDQGLNYWFRMSHNMDEDRSIQRMLPAQRTEFERLLSDPEIRAAHEYSVARHREKIVELMTKPENQEFRASLTSDKMHNLCRRQHHFGSAVFMAGPHVIPDKIALAAELPPDFFFTVDHQGEAEH